MKADRAADRALFRLLCLLPGPCLISNIPHRQQECRFYHYSRLAYQTWVEPDRPPFPKPSPSPTYLALGCFALRIRTSSLQQPYIHTREVIPVRSPNTPASITLRNHPTRNPKPCSPGRSQKQRVSVGVRKQKEAAWPDAYVSSGRCVA